MSHTYSHDHPFNQLDDGDNDEEWEASPKLLRMVEQESREIKPHEEPTKLVNLGTKDNKREVKVDRNIVEHKLLLNPDSRPVKQKLRRIKPEISLRVKEKVEKWLDDGFTTVSTYPGWVANVVVVPKKGGKLRICVDYRDMNKASPNDDFPVPHIDVLVDSTTDHALLSFMDGYSSYHQINMASEDVDKTTFITPWGTFCYVVTSFGLKNTMATYPMVALFYDMMHKEVEIYVDDIICKLVLGFIVSQKGIEVDPEKAKAIIEMSAPRTEKEVRGRITRWQVLLSEYYIVYVTRKAIKASALADYLASQPIEKTEPMNQEFPDEGIMSLSLGEPTKEGVWTLVFDGASNTLRRGIGVVLVSPEDDFTPITVRLCFNCTNNIAEYEACALGLQVALERKVKIVEVFGDSALVIHQLKEEWETLGNKLLPYKDGKDQPLIKIESRDQPIRCCALEVKQDGKPWYHDIKVYIQKKEYPIGASETEKRTLRRLAMGFFLDGDVLYKRNHDMVLLWCLEEKEAEVILKDMHEGSFGTHANEHAMARKILRACYFWMKMETKCCAYVRKCHKCQIYADNINAPPNPLNVLSAP
ncbi:PREDICTED: uncharacterized protein LOC109339546 [Lupinus angustifolius]|uniref:uncharacterized protein LOC109339546 n=1 Tax=Lupinus angustifolius TaxID=3871 RepID=UPI00092F2A5F|nr:PREDICTED: uncharacterized protein LOC109339546 [Lupinus angustifolius]